MPNFTPEFWLQLAGLLVGAGGVYAGIRADLRHLGAAVSRAHERLDDHLGGHEFPQLFRQGKRHG